MITLPNFLLESEVAEMNKLFDAADWESGKETARGAAKDVKSNRQIRRDWELISSLDLVMSQAIRRSIQLRREASPKAYTSPLYSEYQTGDAYGDHVDAMMSSSPPIRLDLSMTVWLADPKSYDGGCLVLPNNTHVKLGAGDAIVYPTTSIHSVSQVTAGKRRVAVCWFQSQFRDPEIRQLVADAREIRDQARAGDGSAGGCEVSMVLANKLVTNLERKFVEL